MAAVVAVMAVTSRRPTPAAMAPQYSTVLVAAGIPIAPAKTGAHT
jgi:hypothetical protein